MCFAPQWRASFINFSSLIWPDGSAPAALASLLFDPPEPQTIGKMQCFATFLPFRASASSFFWLVLFYHLLSSTLFFSLTLPVSAFNLPILSKVWLLNFLRSVLHHTNVHIRPYLYRHQQWMQLTASSSDLSHGHGCHAMALEALLIDCTPLHAAAYVGDQAITRLLWEHGAEQKTNFMEMSLRSACKINIILNHINNLLKRLGTDQAVSVWCAEHLDCNLDSENKRDKCRSVVQLETQGKSQQLTVTSFCFRLPAKVTGRDCGEERILSSIANFVLVLCVKGCLCWPHRRRLIQLCLRHSWLYWLVSPASKGLWDLQWPAMQFKVQILELFVSVHDWGAFHLRIICPILKWSFLSAGEDGVDSRLNMVLGI